MTDLPAMPSLDELAADPSRAAGRPRGAGRSSCPPASVLRVDTHTRSFHAQASPGFLGTLFRR